MQINFTLAVIIFLILFLVFPTLMIVVFFNNKKVLKIVGIVCFVLYCVALACLVFGRVSIKNNVASLTFETNSKWFSSYFIWGSFGKTNVIYNSIKEAAEHTGASLAIKRCCKNPNLKSGGYHWEYVDK